MRERVESRMRSLKLFVGHVVLSLCILYMVIFGGAAGQVGVGAAVVITLTLLFSLLGHGIWWGLREARYRIIQQEIARAQLMDDLFGDEKPKRGGERLMIAADGELVEASEHEGDRQASGGWLQD